MIEKANTAILFFSRTAAEEAAIKTFDPGLGVKANTAISKCLIKKSISICRQTDLPFFTCFSSEQIGNSFGERLANAIESVYNKGFDRVIVIGNDCCFITAELLQNVNHQLESQDLVLGPSEDGGVYLIGITKDTYHRQTFIDLPWQTSQLQLGLKAYAKDLLININWLEVFFDIDHAVDFKKLLKLLPFANKLRKQLIHIITFFQKASFHSTFHFNKKEVLRYQSLRAPPFSPHSL